MNPLHTRISELLEAHKGTVSNPPREDMIQRIVDGKEALVTANGALATWTPPESTGRSPADTVLVRRFESEGEIDWDSPNNVAITPETFDLLVEDAVAAFQQTETIYTTDRVIGADCRYALPVRTVSTRALPVLFADNMFRPVPEDIDQSVFADEPFTVLVAPYHKLKPARYQGHLRTDPKTGRASTMAIAMDLDRRMGVVFGSAYCGSIKKTLFTVINYYLPGKGILPLHCSANEGPDGDSALLLGLSGTGKTTLSADPSRALLGDDEHGWSDDGVANFENGCYAKLINLDKDKEPEIHHAAFHERDWKEHGAIIENAMMWPDGTFDLYDDRLTPNSRVSYPLTYLHNIKPSSCAGHPQTILFLTADANGVIPPVARLTGAQARLWFLMGYTSKLAGTETGVTEPRTAFSRFFGEPFMPRNPSVYSRLLGEKLEKHGTRVYLINTGWIGGPYGIGKRIDILQTRAMVQAALSGELEDVPKKPDLYFKVLVPESCPGIDDTNILQPANAWADRSAYVERANRLAGEFAAHYERAYGNKDIAPEVSKECPGR